MELAASDGWVKISIRPKTGVDVREDVFKLSTANGWALRELHRDGATLEDFFVKVTAKTQYAEA